MDPVSHRFQSVNKTDLESKQILFQSAFTHPSAETLDPGRAWLNAMSKWGRGPRERANRGISNTTHVPRAPGSATYSTEHKTKRERGWKRLMRFSVCVWSPLKLCLATTSYSHEIKQFSHFTLSWVSTRSHTDPPICPQPAVMTLMIHNVPSSSLHTVLQSLTHTPLCPDEAAANKYIRSCFHSPTAFRNHDTVITDPPINLISFVQNRLNKPSICNTAVKVTLKVSMCLHVLFDTVSWLVF